MKVTFDGNDKTITIDAPYSSISIKEDVYSAWKTWVLVDSNISFLPAMRSVGGDPLGGGKFLGDVYFLMNGWQIVTDHIVTVSGTIFHDDGISVFRLEPGGAVQNVVSALVQSVSTTGGTVDPADIAQSVRIEIDSSSQKMLQTIDKLNEVLQKIEETQAFVLSSG